MRVRLAPDGGAASGVVISVMSVRQFDYHTVVATFVHTSASISWAEGLALEGNGIAKVNVPVQVIKFTSDRRTVESMTMWAAALCERK